MSLKNNKSGIGAFDSGLKPISKISFTPIAIACLFLFNAFINIVDIVPDFIGYIIIGAALLKLATMSADVEAAAKCFRYMIVVDLSKYAALMWIFGVTVGREQNNAILLVTFIYAVIEVILLSSAFNKLFSGLIFLGYVHENTAVLGSKKENGNSYTEKIKRSTVIFVVLRAFFSVIPEFAVLTQTEYTEGSFVMYLYEYIGTMRGLAFFFATIIGIVWIVKIFRYFNRINKDESFCNALVEKYNTEIVPKESVFVFRQMSLATVMLVFATVFLIDLRFNGVSIIPDALSAIFFVAGIISLRKLAKFNHILMFILSGIFAAVNLLRYYVEYKFFDEYYYGAVFRAPEVYNAYVNMCIVSLATVIAQLALAVCIYLCLQKVIEGYTGYVVVENAEKNIERIKALHKELKIKALIIIAGAVAAAAGEIFFIFGAVSYGFADEIALIGNLIFIATLIKSFLDVKEEIEAKYMLD